METPPVLNCISGATGAWVSRSAQPKPSAQTISPPTPTATDNPGRFCAVRLARAICRARSTALVQVGDGFARVTDWTLCALGWRGVAVALT